jgi:beta-phosphoglucomutase
LDLDGVLVDKAKYHYLAWKRLPNELGFEFTELENKRLSMIPSSIIESLLLSISVEISYIIY